ncbi:transglycosylase domain-containing protein [Oligoflexus tunisiensis]|uniref:transglycosylase domain-containing protein n=1 Tax=Oligoflexus tunisiensis TaxID=708132 RepID=UPI000A4EA1E5|nr:PBP1A family penicillin-binding protein [Oligoflexus tunisiensis]
MKYSGKKKNLLHVRSRKLWQRLKYAWTSLQGRMPIKRLAAWLNLRGSDRRRKVLLSLGAIGLVLLGTLVWMGLWLQQTGVLHLDQSRLTVIIDYKHSDNSLVYDRNGEKIGEFFSDYHVFVPYENIPKPLIQAVLAVEDRHFFDHHGIDLRGIMRAFLASVRSGGFTQGGSTITQQVVRNFLLSPEKTFERKIKEAILAIQLERHLSKEKILEIYLNALFLGQGSYGVGAASERHFGKPLRELDVHELALIAGLFQSPSRYNPHKAPNQAKRRQRQVLKAMVRAGFLTKETYKTYRRKPLTFKSQSQLNTTFAPYFIDAVQEQTETLLTGDVRGRGLRIHTTLDVALQEEINKVVDQSSDLFAAAATKLVHVPTGIPKVVETAAVVLDHRSGDVLAIVGGRDYARSQFNRVLKAKRAPGSSFKPVVYALALQAGMKWSDMFYVGPVVIQDYRPRNYGGEYLTEATLYNAFYRSINSPVIEIGQRLGTKRVLDLARKMGVTTELKNQAGTLLGGSEVTPMDMAALYATIGNGGVQVDPRMILKITDRDGNVVYEAPPPPRKPKRVLPEQINYLLTDAMRAVFKYGTASTFAEMGAYAGGKTGTTDDAKDNWFCGITSNLTTVVWVGTDNNLAFTGTVAANTLALPVWAKIVQRARQRYPGEDFPVPEGIKVLKVHPLFGHLDPSGIDMTFIEGREPTRTESALSVVRETGNFRDFLDR